MTTNNEFPGFEIDTCSGCGDEQLAFALAKGECYFCTGALTRENPKEEES